MTLRSDYLELKFCSIILMKVLFTAVSFFFAVSFVQTAAGLNCDEISKAKNPKEEIIYVYFALIPSRTRLHL